MENFSFKTWMEIAVSNWGTPPLQQPDTSGMNDYHSKDSDELPPTKKKQERIKFLKSQIRKLS